LAHGIALLLEVAFSREKTCSKPLNRAIYTIVFRLINGLRWSDPQPLADHGNEVSDLAQGAE
jgi:hypothetical protein